MDSIRAKRIREYVGCPQFGDSEYGKWGMLRFEQRREIKELCEWAIYLEALVDIQQKEKLKYNSCLNGIKEQSKKFAIEVNIIRKEYIRQGIPEELANEIILLLISKK